jgi:hypothetical protein
MMAGLVRHHSAIAIGCIVVHQDLRETETDALLSVAEHTGPASLEPDKTGLKDSRCSIGGGCGSHHDYAN